MAKPRRYPPAYASRRVSRRTYIAAYGVATTTAEGRRRLRTAASACEGAGRRVQWSVFECRLSKRELEQLRATLLGILDTRTDRLVLVPLGSGDEGGLEEYGPSLTLMDASVIDV